MAPVRTIRNILMELRKVCQHPYLSAPELEDEDATEAESHKALTEASGKLSFLKLLLPKLESRGHRVLLFSQFKIALDMIEDFLAGEGYKFLRLDGDVQQAQRQKSMDAFNAPNSEYFIFLLTTRAGGVGINLATADTVIVYDPDFNPHMDLQAIARSHRYGQTKSTLVFKLMTRDSVEEQIVLNGKKKMVLDHLVVQQMGKENDEGDIDNMLLHGAAALYDTNAEGYSSSDIRYTSEDVDELIDKVEADALAESKASEEKERLKEVDGNVPAPEDGALPKPKESMSFAFAKIWEADQNRVREMSVDEDEDDQEENDATAWQRAWENLERERQAKLLAESGQRLRQRQAAATNKKYTLLQDGAISDHSDTANLRGIKGKGKSKINNSDVSDGDWYDNPNDQTESDEDLSTLVADGLDIYEMIDGKAVRRTRTVLPNGGDVATTDTSNEAVESANKEGAAPESRAMAIAKKEAKEARRARKQAASAGMLSANSGGSRAIDVTRNQSTANEPAGTGTGIPPPRMDKKVIRDAQNVVQWLYHVLSNLGMKKELDLWARMALPEVPLDQRTHLYKYLANLADGEMYRRGQKRYFATNGAQKLVIQLLTSGLAVIPDDDEEDNNGKELPSVPESLGVMRPKHDNHLRSAPEEKAVTTTKKTKSLNDPRQLGPPANPRASQIAAPAAQSPVNGNGLPTARPQVKPSTSHPSLTFTGDATENRAGPSKIATPGPSSSRSDLLDQLMSSRVPQCLNCNRNHNLAECRVWDVKGLERLRERIYTENWDPRYMLTAVAQVDALIKKLTIEQRMRQALPTAMVSNGQTPSKIGKIPISDAEVIVVDDDDDEEEARMSKRPKLSQQDSLANGASPARGCRICDSQDFHPLKKCPVVTAGPESIKSAMRHFLPSDPTWKTLKYLYGQSAPSPSHLSTPQHVCSFCEESCGKTIRECATDIHGSSSAGRRALKARIRMVEGLNDTNGGAFKVLADELFDAYLKWEK